MNRWKMGTCECTYVCMYVCISRKVLRKKKSGESGIGDVGKGLGASCYLNCVVRMGFID